MLEVKKHRHADIYIDLSTALGIIGAGVLYLPAAIVNVLIGFKLNNKLKEENTKEQI